MANPANTQNTQGTSATGATFGQASQDPTQSQMGPPLVPVRACLSNRRESMLLAAHPSSQPSVSASGDLEPMTATREIVGIEINDVLLEYLKDSNYVYLRYTVDTECTGRIRTDGNITHNINDFTVTNSSNLQKNVKDRPDFWHLQTVDRNEGETQALRDRLANVEAALDETSNSKQLQVGMVSSNLYKEKLTEIRRLTSDIGKLKADGQRRIPYHLIHGPNRIRLELGDCSIHDGVFYVKKKVYIPESGTLRTRIIERVHRSYCGGHSGKHGSYDMLNRWYYWPKMINDVAQYVKNCLACRRSKSYRDGKHGLLHPLPIPERYWSSISMDYITHLPPCTDNGRTYTNVLVIVDRLSKKKKFIPVVDLKVDTLVKAFVDLSLDFKNRGPFTVTRVIDNMAYELLLPPEMGKLHNVFHPWLLHLHEEAPLPGQLRDSAPAEFADPDEEDGTSYERSSPILSAMDQLPAGTDNPSWEPYMNLVDSADIVQQYHESRPKAPGPHRKFATLAGKQDLLMITVIASSNNPKPPPGAPTIQQTEETIGPRSFRNTGNIAV
ncbi:hypothetical protein A1F94_005507 [Pyrenophora tritici-repentis]|nr:hypothetical protein A1F94_005507 [Pyrenophora tritici-repentis]